MEIELKRDGLTLRGQMDKPAGVDKCPAVILFHGFMGSRGKEPGHQFAELAKAFVGNGMAVIRFDFNAHGDSDGEFRNMTILGELLDASKIMEYTKSLDFVTDIYIVGHSMGGVVGGMTAGYYRDYVSKLVLLAPAATMKEDSLKGSLFGIEYDAFHVPDTIPVKDGEGRQYEVGSFQIRATKTLPIYETTAMFRGKTLIIHGSEDEAVGVIGSRRYKEWMPVNTELVIIEGEGHGLNKFAFEDVKSRVVEFLKN